MVWLTRMARTVVAGELVGHLGLELEVRDGRASRAFGIFEKSGQSRPLKKCFFRMRDASAASPAMTSGWQPFWQRLSAMRREVAHVVEVRVAHEHRLERALRVELHAARQRAGVDGERVVDDERARPMPRGLAAVAADDAKLHGRLQASNLRGISRNSRNSSKRGRRRR